MVSSSAICDLYHYSVLREGLEELYEMKKRENKKFPSTRKRVLLSVHFLVLSLTRHTVKCLNDGFIDFALVSGLRAFFLKVGEC